MNRFEKYWGIRTGTGLAQAIFDPKPVPVRIPQNFSSHPPSYWCRLFSSQTCSCTNTATFLKPSHSTPTCRWRRNRQSFPKRRHIKFKRQGITQKKAYNIQDTAKVLKARSCWLRHKAQSKHCKITKRYCRLGTMKQSCSLHNKYYH